MTTPVEPREEQRTPLSKERVLEAAVTIADEHGIDGLSMRKLGQQLGVEAMSLYHHVKNKEDLLDGMVDHTVSEIELVPDQGDWKSTMQQQILAARKVMSAHQWAPGVIETRKTVSMPMMRYYEAIGRTFIEGGFSVELLHHGVHVLGSRVLGFSQELYDDSQDLEQDPQIQAIMLQQMKAEFPTMSMIVEEISHDEDTIVGAGCDDDVEFMFSINLILDGLQRIRDAA